MKILLHSTAGDGVGLASQMSQEGHDVLLHLAGKKSRLYDGMLYKVDDWEKIATQSDLVIFDGNGMGGRADSLRARGVKVWNGGALADALEKDRSFGMKVFEKAGIPTPETFKFGTASQAKEIVSANFRARDRMVIKLDDFGACATSYVARDRADMLAQIATWEADPTIARIDKGGIIQRFVEGVEISIEGWFNGTEFMYPFNVTMEDKCLLNGNKGPNTGCAQNVVWQLRNRAPKLSKMIVPLAPLLRKGNFVGQIDVNTIVAEDGSGPYALEFTPRPGFDATSTLVLGLAGYAEACLAAVTGASELPLGQRPWDYLTAVRAWIPPYPFESTKPSFNAELYDQIRGVPIEGWEQDDPRILLYDAMVTDDDKVVMAGTNGIAFISLGSGRTLDQSVADCYRQLEAVQVPNLGYRTDLGERCRDGLGTVEGWLG